METNSQPRLYNIQHDHYFLHTGRIKNGNQILIGVQLPELVILEFDADGNYLRIVTREIPKQFLSDANDVLRVDDYILSTLIENWQNEIGLVPGTISVKKFFLPDQWIGIKDLPVYYQELLDRPEGYNEELRLELEEEMEQWLDSGNFVFWWSQDYDLNREGEIIGS